MENRKLEKEFENIGKCFSYNYERLNYIQFICTIIFVMVLVVFIMNTLMCSKITLKLNKLTTLVETQVQK